MAVQCRQGTHTLLCSKAHRGVYRMGLLERTFWIKEDIFLQQWVWDF